MHKSFLSEEIRGNSISRMANKEYTEEDTHIIREGLKELFKRE